ncbi:peptidylprolyl isomerase [Lachnospiraceae bacterium 45-P1]
MEAENKTTYETPKEQLKNVNDAIFKILVGGQSYRIGTRSLTRADLSALIAERNRLEAQLQGDGASLLAGAYAADFGPDNRR